MRIGLFAGGFAQSAGADYLTAVAMQAEVAGFDSLWLGEHAVLFESYPQSRYPYRQEGGPDAPLPDPTVPLIDPLIGLTWAAAHTSTIEIGSAILILPQRHPLLLAKELATLDQLSGGRLAVGIGAGWAKEEMDAFGLDWAKRGRRMDDYIAALRSLWRDDAATLVSESASFARAYSFPKPVRRDLPLLIGGESKAAMRRVATAGDGWIANKLAPGDAAETLGGLRRMTAEAGRDPDALRLIVTIFPDTPRDALRAYRDAGATDFQLLALDRFPADRAGVATMVGQLGEAFVAFVHDL